MAYELWKIIDDIDTADDIAKDNEKIYRGLVRIEQNKRWETLNDNQVTELYKEMEVNP